MKKSFFNLVAASAAACVFAFNAWAQDVRLKDSHPDSYTVVKGDTLWDISDKFLENPWVWPEIWQVNPQIENPHLIFPGDVISLVYLDGKPRLTLQRTYKMSPGTVKMQPSVKVMPLDEAIPAIPLDRINSFLSRSRVLDEGVIEDSPYVVAGEDKRLIVGAGDNIYSRGEFAEGIKSYGIYRKGQVYRDPETKEVLGIEARDIGSVSMRDIKGEIATLEVSRSTEEVRTGDRVLPTEERSIDSTFYPSAPEDEAIRGLIVAVEGGVTQVGYLDVVALNLGERDKVEVGNVLAVYKRGELVRDRIAGDMVELPEERAGLLMIFRTFEKMSLGIVLDSQKPLAVLDRLYNPEGPVRRGDALPVAKTDKEPKKKGFWGRFFSDKH